MRDNHWRMPTGLVSAGLSTARAEPGVCQSVATETATHASRPTVNGGAPGTTLGATVEGDVEANVEGEAVTLVGGGPARVGSLVGLLSAVADDVEGTVVPEKPPEHDVSRATHVIITTATGRLTPRAWRQETLGSRIEDRPSPVANSVLPSAAAAPRSLGGNRRT
ncbi:MAG: hypothetical protein HHJ11_14495 [Phycicoccus sp.]|nr:hypothetical protein [Phycicoccus sp.]NMM33527.1 hypothetical protein [Phycicoccus sp.]